MWSKLRGQLAHHPGERHSRSALFGTAGFVVALLLVGAACSPTSEIRSSPEPTSCPVTIANGSDPPGERHEQLHHGNGRLWTDLWPDGRVVVSDPGWIQPDGRIALKWPWWRSRDAAGELSITGRRLDAEVPPLEAIVPSGYGQTGFQVSGLIFSTPGCWEVTGHAGGYALTFVTEVVLAPELTGQASGGGTGP
jgi:hypothetical protein